MEEAAKMFGPMFMLMFNSLGALAKGVYKKFGNEALPIITKVAEESGVKQAEMMQGMLKSRDMKSIGEMFKMFEMMGMEFEIVDLTEDKFHFKTTKCPLGIEDTSKGLCEAMMTSDKTMVSTLLGKELKMEIPKCVAAGDKYCEVIYTTK